MIRLTNLLVENEVTVSIEPFSNPHSLDKIIDSVPDITRDNLDWFEDSDPVVKQYNISFEFEKTQKKNTKAVLSKNGKLIIYNDLSGLWGFWPTNGISILKKFANIPTNGVSLKEYMKKFNSFINSAPKHSSKNAFVRYVKQIYRDLNSEYY